jgi:hypothetical protein
MREVSRLASTDKYVYCVTQFVIPKNASLQLIWSFSGGSPGLLVNMTRFTWQPNIKWFLLQKNSTFPFILRASVTSL